MDSPQYVKKNLCTGYYLSFKPYYKWIVLNTLEDLQEIGFSWKVLNLIING